MRVWTLVVDHDRGISTTVHLSEDAAIETLFATYDPENSHGRDIQALIDTQGLAIYIEGHNLHLLGEQVAEPPRMLLTEDGELKCPLCGHEGPMARVSVAQVWDRVFHWEGVGLDDRNDDIMDLEPARYSCWNCDQSLALPEGVD